VLFFAGYLEYSIYYVMRAPINIFKV